MRGKERNEEEKLSDAEEGLERQENQRQHTMEVQYVPLISPQGTPWSLTGCSHP